MDVNIFVLVIVVVSFSKRAWDNCEFSCIFKYLFIAIFKKCILFGISFSSITAL